VTVAAWAPIAPPQDDRARRAAPARSVVAASHVAHRRSLARCWGAIPISFAIALWLLRMGVQTAPLDRLADAARELEDPPGATAHVGSIFVARGGPVIIGFQSDGDARLSFAGHELRGSAVVTERIIVPHGPIALRFAGPPGARLVWNPVGRRGDPEYVSASSLSPLPPARATFDAPGTEPLDGAIALGLLVTLVASLCVLARARLARVPRATWLAMAGVFVVGVAVRWIDLGGFGQTWDEDTTWTAGRNYITNLVALDFSARSWIWNYEHPPVTKLLAGIGAQFADGFGPARAMSAIWSALGCALLVPIATRLFRPRVGALAGAIATLLPPLVAHGQIVGHESPAVLGWALAIVLALSVHDELPSDDRRAARVLGVRLAWLGATVGVAVASRFTNAPLGLLCAAIVVLQAPRAWRRATIIRGAIAMPLAACAAFYAVWPRLWTSPFTSLAESLHRFNLGGSPEPYFGVITAHPGPHYFLTYLFATLPVGILLGVIAGGVRLFPFALRGNPPRRPLARFVTDNRVALIIGLWFVLGLAVTLSPLRRDGVRYVIPCILACAVLAAAGFDQLAIWARDRRTFPAIAALVLAYLGITLARIHPYYLDYFGEQVGGPGAVAARSTFETAWWGEGLDRAVAYVNDHAAPGARVYRGCIEPQHLAWFREDLWTPMADTPDAATWIVAYAPASHPCNLPPDARQAFTVSTGGLVLAAVYQRP
jgi:4-amino-4-deoxy-L-arabinose transferase-like glycosyltransferase